MKNFLIRTASGFVFVFVIVSLLIVHQTGMFVLFLLINILALIEFYNLSYKIKVLPYKLPGVISGVIIYTLAYLVAIASIPREYLLFAILIIPMTGIIPLFYKASTVFKSWGPTLFGILYVSVPLSFLPFISYITGEYNYKIPLGIFIIIWLNDSFAYITGSLLGKTRIFPSVSPKKTWEGSIGGLVFSTAGAVALSAFLGILPLLHWLILTIVIVITAILGDLIESALKRNAGVKDSGFLMPGHGGTLDRFDSFLFSVPFVFIYLYLMVF